MYSLPLLTGDMKNNKQHDLMVTMVRMDTVDTVRNAQVEGKVRAAWHLFQVLELVSFPGIMSELEEAIDSLPYRNVLATLGHTYALVNVTTVLMA